ncbi:MAG: acyl carrier protein [Clostridia bacterium]|nr:acyl carrier protein [Clostridia bacterium]
MLETVIRIIREQGMVNPETVITVDTRLAKELYLDSLDLVEIVCSLEEEWNIAIPNENMADFQTVADLVAAVENNL